MNFQFFKNIFKTIWSDSFPSPEPEKKEIKFPPNNSTFEEEILFYIKQNNLISIIKRIDLESPEHSKYERKFYHDIIFTFAHEAMIKNKIEIFDWLISFYQKNNPGIQYGRRTSSCEFTKLVETIIDLDKTQYMDILGKYRLFCGNKYLSYHLTNCEDDKNLKRVEFILQNFPHVQYPEDPLFTLNKPINKEELFVKACDAKETKTKEIVEEFMEYGVDIHHKNGLALHMASYNNSIEVVKILIAKGITKYANINEIALSCAQVPENLEMVQYLVEKGAQVNIENCSLIAPEIYIWLKINNLKDKLEENLSNDNLIKTRSNKI